MCAMFFICRKISKLCSLIVLLSSKIIAEVLSLYTSFKLVCDIQTHMTIHINFFSFVCTFT